MLEKVIRGVAGANLFNVGYNLPNLGVLKASLSPQNNRILNLLAPNRIDGTVNYETKDASCAPRVNFEWLEEGGAYTVRESPTCSADSLTGSNGNNYLYVDQYAEAGFKLSECDINALNADLNDWHKVLTDGKRTGQTVYGGRWRSFIEGELMKSTKALLSHVNDKATNALVNMVGVNPIYGTDAAQTIPLFTQDNKEGARVSFVKEVSKLRRMRNIQGLLIVVTGDNDLLDWLTVTCGYGCCSDTGFDFSKVNNRGLEVYYAPEIEDELGAGGFLIVEPEAFATLNIDKFRNLKIATGKNTIATTTLGAFRIQEPSIRKLDALCVSEGVNPMFTFDLRMKEQDCNNGNFLPELMFIPSIQYNFWTKPANTEGVTGVYRYIAEKYNSGIDINYTVTFDTDGGSAITAQNRPLGSLVFLPITPTKDSKNFDGWYTDDTFATPWNFATDTISGDTTIYAKWTD